ncbi:MAG: endonuclease domain-containing protein [Sulfuricaulis sp.]
MARRYWSCPKCHGRWERVYTRCQTEGCLGRKPAKRVPVHARTLRDDSYKTYVEVNARIHSITDESCGVCGKPRSQERRHDRDHGHLQGSSSFGRPRGLACVSCNRLMPRELTAERARLIAEYLDRVDVFYLSQKKEAA